MLVEFSVTNFRSLKQRVTLSMLAEKDATHAEDLIHMDAKRSLIPVAAIYGANSAGKSNVLLALQTMQDMISGESSQLLKKKELPYDPFMFDAQTQRVPTEFEIVFIYEGIKYRYAFTYTGQQILKEELHHWPLGKEALIFSRIGSDYSFRENVNEQKTLAARTPENRLYLVTATQWNLAQTEKAYLWFANCLMRHDEQNSPNATAKELRGIISDNPLRQKIMKELLQADLGIVDIGVSDKEPDNMRSDDENDYEILFVHKTTVEGGTERFPLPISRESKGTQRFFSRIGPWIKALDQGGILFIDELESSMHPLLTRRLIEMVQDHTINTNHAQLIFTTHDTLLLDLKLLRRDQLWFAEKNPDSLGTELFSLWEFSPRKDENVLRGYLQGRYGAIPFLGGEL